MKKKIKIVIVNVMLLLIGHPNFAYAELGGAVELKPGVYQVKTNENMFTEKNKVSLYDKQSEKFKKKTKQERESLTEDEKKIVDYIENYVNERINLKERSLVTEMLENIVVDLSFEFGFKRNNMLFDIIEGVEDKKGKLDNYLKWHSNLSNSTERTLDVFDEPTGKNIKLYARYINNNSDKTIILHSGYRSTQFSFKERALFFSEQGYNVLQPETRSHDRSEGEYITFGNYEKDDLNKWIDQEISSSPEQNIILYGESMGAATTMLSQATPHPNVKAYIEDCGYDSVVQQLKDTVHIITPYLKYIPMLNDINWFEKEEKLVQILNEKKIKPILKFDLYEVSPLESVKTSNIPKLFIHGDADWFIPPVAMNNLYSNSIGYKEKLSVQGAGHALSFEIGGNLYKEAVLSFFKNVDAINPRKEVIADDVNLLTNPTFEFMESGFNNWETSTNFENEYFSENPLAKNSFSEFVMKKSNQSEDIVTAISHNGGIRFYTKYGYNDGLVGQNIELIKDETYELSFTAKNETNAVFTYPNVLFGIDNIKRDESLKNSEINYKKLQYKANETGNVKVKIGGKLGHYAWYDLTKYSHTAINNLQLLNTDRISPSGIIIMAINSTAESCFIQGKGEKNNFIVIEDINGEETDIIKTNNDGVFSLTLSKNQGSIFHLINKDVKGNKSESRVVVIQ